MAIYAISDLHLSLSIDKPMDIFGQGWTDYMNKLKTQWEDTVAECDTVIIPGDISWATYLEQAESDLKFIEALPGKKIISKGNHDYWWTTLSKLNKYMVDRGFRSISFMHNNSFKIDGYVLCGTRGWKCPGDEGFTTEDRKIYDRELQRLELSLRSFEDSCEKIIVALHYPPFNLKKESSGFVDIMNKYKVNMCIYGHLHGEGFKNAVPAEFSGISCRLVSADFLKFRPLRIDNQ